MAPSRTNKSPDPHPRALSLFSGCGGFCEGMHRAGFNVAAAVELDRFACETYRHNFPHTALYEGDIAKFTTLSADCLRAEYGLTDVELVFGGPPCQGYSQIGTRDLDDPRNQLYKRFTDVLRLFEPPMFVMENVPNMLLLRGGLYRKAALKEFEAAGYPGAIVVVLDASEYGIPQQRRRVFYIGLHRKFRVPYDMEQRLRALISTHRVARPTTVWEAIGDLPSEVVASGETMAYPCAPQVPSAFLREMRLDMDGTIYTAEEKQAAKGMGGVSSPLLHNHHTKEIQARRLALIKMLKPGLKGDSLPRKMWDGLRPEKWRRLHPDWPAHTLLAQMHRDLSEFVHPSLHRWITVREALRLQTFHDGFVTVTSEWQQLKQIGNAVPPLLGRIVGLAARQLLSEKILNETAKSTLPRVGTQLALAPPRGPRRPAGPGRAYGTAEVPPGVRVASGRLALRGVPSLSRV